MKSRNKKIFSILLLIAFASMAVFADTSISADTGISVVDKSLQNIFEVLQKVGIGVMIVAIVVCGLLWAIPYLMQKEDGRGNENLMKLIIKIGIATVVIAACLFAPAQIYKTITGETAKTATDFVIERTENAPELQSAEH